MNFQQKKNHIVKDGKQIYYFLLECGTVEVYKQLSESMQAASYLIRVVKKQNKYKK